MFIFTPCLFLHSVCTVCGLFPLFPCGSWFDWPSIHAHLLEIPFNPLSLGRKIPKRSHLCPVPCPWAAEESTRKRSQPPKNPFLVQEPILPHSQGCRTRHVFTAGGHPLPWGSGEPPVLHISPCHPHTQTHVSAVAEGPPASVILWNYICKLFLKFSLGKCHCSIILFSQRTE